MAPLLRPELRVQRHAHDASDRVRGEDHRRRHVAIGVHPDAVAGGDAVLGEAVEVRRAGVPQLAVAQGVVAHAEGGSVIGLGEARKQRFGHGADGRRGRGWRQRGPASRRRARMPAALPAGSGARRRRCTPETHGAPAAASHSPGRRRAVHVNVPVPMPVGPHDQARPRRSGSTFTDGFAGIRPRSDRRSFPPCVRLLCSSVFSLLFSSSAAATRSSRCPMTRAPRT